MASVDPRISRDVQAMKLKATTRDRRMAEVGQVRDGDIDTVAPDLFSPMFPKPVVANFIDVVARHLTEVIAPLPSLSCSSGAMKSEADKRRAERKNRIGEHYWRCSKLEEQMFYAADRYLTFGFLPIRIEADYEYRQPRIVADDPCGAYYRLDRYKRVTAYARTYTRSTDDLAAEWPEYAHLISGQYHADSSAQIDVVCYWNDTDVVMYLPQRDGLVLSSYKHGMSRCPVEIAQRPGLRDDPRGQFDDVLWVQLARGYLAQLALELGHKSVQAPFIVPTDVQELPIGPDSVIQTDHPEGVGQAKINVPTTAFALGAELDQELKTGTRYPDVAGGNADASVITGKGVQALMGGFDTQIKSAQTILGRVIRDATSLAFEMDERVWPGKTEPIRGTVSGRSYEMRYTPRVDIAGNYVCDVTYGFASGMAPQNAAVMLLQLRGDGLIDRDFFRRNLPFPVDAEQAQRDLDVQETEDALKQGLFAALQASGQMLANGQSDQAMMFFHVGADLIKGRENGKPLSDVLVQAFDDFQPKQQEQAQAAQQAAGAAGAGGGTPGVGPNGLSEGVAPGQAGMPPGGLPDISSLIAGFRGGNAQMDSSVRRRIPTG